jgi:hypothetical protein
MLNLYFVFNILYSEVVNALEEWVRKTSGYDFKAIGIKK